MIAILAQNGNSIALFEHLRINQNTQEVHLFRSTHNPLATWVAPRARLAEELFSSGPVSNTIVTFTAPNLVFNQNGAIDGNLTTNTVLTRIPYVVSLWEHMDLFPVFTLMPDNFLPWNRTLISNIYMPRRTLNVNHFLLQNSPVPTITDRTLADDAQCPITLEHLTVDIAYWLACGHVFSDAIFHAVDIDPRCPLCRRATSINDITSA
jgi:hypothetical protein